MAIDFILGLPPSKKFRHGDEEFNAAMTATDKFTKAVIILPGKDTYTAPDWATRFWQLVYSSWGPLSGLISDQDPKFLSEFWKGLFEKAGKSYFFLPRIIRRQMGKVNGQIKRLK